LLEPLKPAISSYNKHKKCNIGTAAPKIQKKHSFLSKFSKCRAYSEADQLNEYIRFLEAEVVATGTSFRKLDNVVKAKKHERKYWKR
jgi:hypothetical protein